MHSFSISILLFITFNIPVVRIFFENSIDPDHMASSEASWTELRVFSKKKINPG